MGKVVKAVLFVAAAVALVVFAPQIGIALASIGFSSAVATAIIATATSLAIGMAVRSVASLIVGAPRVPTSPPGYPLGTACLLPGAPRPPLTERRMPAKRDSWLAHLNVWGFGRFRLTFLEGSCMSPALPPDSWGIVDIEADIREGDLAYFRPADYRTALAEYGDVPGIVKRFEGLNRDLGFVEFTCTNPPRVIHTGLSTLRAVHRVRAVASSEAEAWRLLREVRRDPGAFDERRWRAA